jgi:hypothetical protein
MEQLLRDQASCELVLRVMIQEPDLAVPPHVVGVRPQIKEKESPQKGGKKARKSSGGSNGASASPW